MEELPSEMVRAILRLITSTSALAGEESLRDRLRQFEAGIILQAIDDAGGDLRLAAQALGISLSSLYGKLNRNDRK